MIVKHHHRGVWKAPLPLPDPPARGTPPRPFSYQFQQPLGSVRVSTIITGVRNGTGCAEGSPIILNHNFGECGASSSLISGVCGGWLIIICIINIITIIGIRRKATHHHRVSLLECARIIHHRVSSARCREGSTIIFNIISVIDRQHQGVRRSHPSSSSIIIGV